MPIRFARPVGPHLDIRELEYLSALHQSAPQLRADGRITAQDVRNYLRSRHGLQVGVEYLQNVFMPGLAGAFLGSTEDGAEAVFDLVEIVCILLIPHFCREFNEKADASFFDRVLDIILRDVTGATERPVLTRALLRDVLEAYGELPDDEGDAMVEAMLQAAGGVDDADADDLDDDTEEDDHGIRHQPRRLTARVLAQATTGDVRPYYNLTWEDSVTTHFDDVFHGSYLDTSGAPVDGVSHMVTQTTTQLATVAAGTTSTQLLQRLHNSTNNNNKKNNHGDTAHSGTEPRTTERDGDNNQAAAPKKNNTQPVQRIFTFSSIDYVAENFRSVHFTMVLWVTIVVTYFSYLWGVRHTANKLMSKPSISWLLFRTHSQLLTAVLASLPTYYY